MQITAFLLILLFSSTHAAVNPDTDVKSRCRSALQFDFNIPQNRQTVKTLIQEIKQNEARYLKSRMYPQIRKCYQQLQAKMGDYYFRRDNFKGALHCFTEADKYAVRGYRKEISVCRENVASTILKSAGGKVSRDDLIFFQTAGDDFKIYFQAYFYDHIKNLDARQDIEAILSYSDFQKQLKNFLKLNKDDPAYMSNQLGLETLFIRVQGRYNQQVITRMSRLEPLETRPKKIARLTGDDPLAKKIKDYIDSLRALRKILPPGKHEVENAGVLFEKIDKKFSIDQNVKMLLTSYLDAWHEYYRVEDGDSYIQKRTAAKDKSNKLSRIKQIAANIKILDRKSHRRKVDKLLDQAGADESKWRFHMEMANAIDRFENEKNPTLHELYKIRETVFNAPESAAFEGPLLECIERFLAVPPRTELNLARLENFLENGRNRKDNITRVLLKEFETRLLAQLKRLSKKTKLSLKDRADIKKYTDKYEAYVGKKPPGFSENPRSIP